MSRVKLFIDFMDKNNSEIDYTQTGLPSIAHTISNPTALDVPHANEIKPFIIGASKLGNAEDGGDGHYFWGNNEEFRCKKQVGGKVDWFISEQTSDEQGNFTQPLSFLIAGTNIDHFIINFDARTKQWATLLNIDGQDYINDDEDFIWKGVVSDVHTIQLKRWNKPLFQARITSILVGITLEFDRSNIKQFVAGSRGTYDNTEPYSEVIGQYGDIEITDINGRLLEFSQLELLNARLPVRVYFNVPEKENNESEKDYMERIEDCKIGDYLTEQFKYGFGDTKVNTSLQDDILEWNKISFSGIADSEENTAATFFNLLKEATPSNVNATQDTINYFEIIFMPDGYISAGNLMDAWNTFLAATDTKIYKITSGEIWIVR